MAMPSCAPTLATIRGATRRTSSRTRRLFRFLQYGRKDAPLPESVARHDSALFNGPKKVAFYNAGHELDSAARRERVEWLVDHLKLRPVDRRALERIPQVH